MSDSVINVGKLTGAINKLSNADPKVREYTEELRKRLGNIANVVKPELNQPAEVQIVKAADNVDPAALNKVLEQYRSIDTVA